MVLAIPLWMGSYVVSNISLLPPPLKLASSAPFLPPGWLLPGVLVAALELRLLGHLLSLLLCTGVPVSVYVCLSWGPLPASVASLPGLTRPFFFSTQALDCSLQALAAGKDCNPQNRRPGSSQQLLRVGPRRLPDLQILQASLAGLLPDPWDQNRGVAKKMHRKTPPWGRGGMCALEGPELWDLLFRGFYFSHAREPPWSRGAMNHADT